MNFVAKKSKKKFHKSKPLPDNGNDIDRNMNDNDDANMATIFLKLNYPYILLFSDIIKYFILIMDF